MVPTAMHILREAFWIPCSKEDFPVKLTEIDKFTNEAPCDRMALFDVARLEVAVKRLKEGIRKQKR